MLLRILLKHVLKGHDCRIILLRGRLQKIRGSLTWREVVSGVAVEIVRKCPTDVTFIVLADPLVLVLRRRSGRGFLLALG